MVLDHCSFGPFRINLGWFSNVKPRVLLLFLFVLVSLPNSLFTNMNEEVSYQAFSAVCFISH